MGMAKDAGRCRAAITRYYFDGKRCSKFTWGGCGGNKNNFKSNAECMAKCRSFMNGKGPAPILKPMPKPSLILEFYWKKVKGSGGKIPISARNNGKGAGKGGNRSKSVKQIGRGKGVYEVKVYTSK